MVVIRYHRIIHFRFRDAWQGEGMRNTNLNGDKWKWVKIGITNGVVCDMVI